MKTVTIALGAAMMLLAATSAHAGLDQSWLSDLRTDRNGAVSVAIDTTDIRLPGHADSRELALRVKTAADLVCRQQRSTDYLLGMPARPGKSCAQATFDTVMP